MKILVVDDEQDLCEILRFNLESEGFEVDTATSAEEALLLTGPYDLLLLDVMMDRMSGFEMADQLRANGDTTPIIFLTALGSHDDQLHGFGVGADDYVTKPFSFDTVLARIRAVLRRVETGKPKTTGRTAALAIPSTLTRREHLIYKLFSENPGRYFTREEIITAVWPDDTCVSERSVDVHIARLRKKIGLAGNRIVNKTGFGYGLV